MKHSIPGFNEDGVWVEKGPTSPTKRGPKAKGPRTMCHICGASFFSRKQRSKHQQISHRKSSEVFTADGLPVKT